MLRCAIQILCTGEDGSTPCVLVSLERWSPYGKEDDKVPKILARHLINAGECTSKLCKEHKVSLNEVSKVFLLRCDADSCSGLPGVILRLASIGKPSLFIYGPHPAQTVIQATATLIGRSYPSVDTVSFHLEPDERDACFSIEDDFMDIHAGVYSVADRDAAATVQQSLIGDTSGHSCIYVFAMKASSRHRALFLSCQSRAHVDAVSSHPLVEGKFQFVFHFTEEHVLNDADYSKLLRSDLGRHIIVNRSGSHILQAEVARNLAQLNVVSPRTFPLHSAMRGVHTDNRSFNPNFIRGEMLMTCMLWPPDLVAVHPPREIWVDRDELQESALMSVICVGSKASAESRDAALPTSKLLDFIERHMTAFGFESLRDIVAKYKMEDSAKGSATDGAPPLSTLETERCRLKQLLQLTLSQFTNDCSLGSSEPLFLPPVDGRKLSSHSEMNPAEESTLSTIPDKSCCPKRCLDTSNCRGEREKMKRFGPYNVICNNETEFPAADRADPADLSHPSAAANPFPSGSKLIFLGTGSAEPSKNRGASGILLSLSRSEASGAPSLLLLLDAGEGTFGHLCRGFGREGAIRILSELTAVFISHKHADHTVGLWRLLSIRSQRCRHMPSLPVVAPISVLEWLDHVAVPGTFLPIQFDGCSLKNIHPFYELCAVPVNHCHEAHALVLSSRSGSSKRCLFAYSGDTRPCNRLVAAGLGAELLVHEATFDDELQKDAMAKRHSTTSEAIEVAKRMGAHHVILTHFSQRYPRVPPLREGQKVAAAFDGMTVDLGCLERLPSVVADANRMALRLSRGGADACDLDRS